MNPNHDGKDQRMNQNDWNNPFQGQPNPTGTGAGNGPAFGSQQGYGQQAYPQNPQGYPQNLQGYPQNQQAYPLYQQPYNQQTGYQAPPGYQISTSHQRISSSAFGQGYQTPQVTGTQTPVSGYRDREASGYQNTYPSQAALQTQNGYAAAQPYPVQPGTSEMNRSGAVPAGYPQGYGPMQTGTGAPQNPYGSGYPSAGYGGQGYPQPGYNAYTQMGRTQQAPYQQQNFGGQVPLNGGGYVPQPVKVRRRPFEIKDSYLLIFSGILLILFAAGMFLGGGNQILRLAFLVLAAGSVALLWIKPLTAANKKLCYTIVFGLLSVITIISLITAGTGSDPTNQGVVTNPTGASVTPVPDEPFSQNGVYSVTSAPEPSTPEPETDNEVTNRLETFFTYWAANQYDNMLTLCSPTWRNKSENPKNDLFVLMRNRTPKDYMVENISGTNQDMSRSITVSSLMDMNNGKDPVRYRLSVIMIKESDGLWYLDPQSLQSNEPLNTPDPSVTDTPAPTETPLTDANTVLYYNPDGGSFYHRDQNCKKINERYLPLKGKFTYAELNQEPYKNLKPCAICGAPSPGQ